MRRSYQTRALFLTLALVLPACAHVQRAQSQAVIPVHEPLKIVATPGAWGPHAEAYDAESLFQQGNADLKAGQHQAALDGYERLLREFPGTRFTAPALYNAGLALEGLHRYGDGALRYAALLALPPGKAAPSARDQLDARFRLALCQGESGDHAAAVASYRALLLGRDLEAADRVEATARLGHELLAQDALAEAETTLLQVAELAQAAAGDKSEAIEDSAAMAQFDLGEVSHSYFRALPLRLPQAQLEQDLDQKARLLLYAQGRYIEAVRRRHPRWAPAAGFQLGALYREMYEAVINAPLPPDLDSDDKRQVYLDLVRGKLRVLLERARRVHERNMALAEYLGDRGAWAQRSAEQLADLDRLLAPPTVAPAMAAP